MNGSQPTKHDGLSPEQLHFLRDLEGQGLEVKLHLLQHYAKLAEMLAREIMDEEVLALVGERYSRGGPHGGRYSRWGTNPGSIQIGEERVPNAGIPAYWASPSATTSAWPASSWVGSA